MSNSYIRPREVMTVFAVCLYNANEAMCSKRNMTNSLNVCSCKCVCMFVWFSSNPVRAPVGVSPAWRWHFHSRSHDCTLCPSCPHILYFLHLHLLLFHPLSIIHHLYSSLFFILCGLVNAPYFWYPIFPPLPEHLHLPAGNINRKYHPPGLEPSWLLPSHLCGHRHTL